MRYTAFYIIRPRERLLQKLSEETSSILELSEPVLWTNEQGGRSVWSKNDYVQALKYLFVANVKNLLPKHLIQNVFGDLPITVMSFDAWWRMECFDGFDETFENAIEELRVTPIFKELAFVDNPIIKGFLKRG